MTERLVPYNLGETAVSGELENLLGYRAFFEDVDRSGTGVKAELSGMTVEAVWVKNESGGNLSGGQIVLWDTGSTYDHGKAVNAAGDDVHGIGVVDPDVTTVSNDTHFWLIVKGPTKVRYDGSASLAIRDELCTAASGNTREYVFGTDDADSRFGVSLAAKTSGSAGDKFRALVDFTV